jgi:hypothetical protein
MAPRSLSHGDGAPGAGAEDCITSINGFWRVTLGSSPIVVQLDIVSFLPSSSVLTVSGCQLGGYPVGLDQ